MTRSYRIVLLGLFLATLLIASALADTVTLNATGTGFCASGIGCDNTNVYSWNNYLASPDYRGHEFNDWFAFDLSGVTQTITGATLTAFNPLSVITGTEVYSLYGSSGFSNAGLVSGPVLGSISATDSLSGQDVSITFNGAGIAALNANLGSKFVLGGSLASPNAGTSSSAKRDTGVLKNFN